MTEFGNTCSHYVPWGEDCPQCNLASARELVAHWGEKIDEARALISRAAPDRYIEHFMREGRAQAQGGEVKL